jgi:hypothetical protein
MFFLKIDTRWVPDGYQWLGIMVLKKETRKGTWVKV